MIYLMKDPKNLTACEAPTFDRSGEENRFGRTLPTASPMATGPMEPTMFLTCPVPGPIHRYPKQRKGQLIQKRSAGE